MATTAAETRLTAEGLIRAGQKIHSAKTFGRAIAASVLEKAAAQVKSGELSEVHVRTEFKVSPYMRSSLKCYVVKELDGPGYVVCEDA